MARQFLLLDTGAEQRSPSLLFDHVDSSDVSRNFETATWPRVSSFLRLR